MAQLALRNPVKITPHVESPEAQQERANRIRAALHELDFLTPEAQDCLRGSQGLPIEIQRALVMSIAGTPPGKKASRSHCVPEAAAYTQFRFDDCYSDIKEFRRAVKQICGRRSGNGESYYGRPQHNGNLCFTPTGLMHMLSSRTDTVGRAYRELLSSLMGMMTQIFMDQQRSHLELSAQHQQNRRESIKEFNGLKETLRERQPALQPASAQGVAANLDKDWQCKYLGIPQDNNGRYLYHPRQYISSIIPCGLKPGPVADAYDVEGAEALSAGRAVMRQHTNRLTAADLNVTTSGRAQKGMKRRIQETQVSNVSLDDRLEHIRLAFTFDSDNEEHIRKAVKRPSILHPSSHKDHLMVMAQAS